MPGGNEFFIVFMVFITAGRVYVSTRGFYVARPANFQTTKMNLLQEIQQAKNTTKAMIDMLGGNLSTLEKAEAVLLENKQPSSRATSRRTRKSTIMTEIIKIETNGGKPSIAKK